MLAAKESSKKNNDHLCTDKVIILKPVMINKSRRYMWLMQRQINLINGTLFVLEKRNTVISELCQKSCGFDLYSST